MQYTARPLGRWTDPETVLRKGAHIFKASWFDTLALLGDEIDHLGGQQPVILQLDVRETDIRADGMLKARARPVHPGVVLSFGSRFGPLRYATDAYEKVYGWGSLEAWQANVRAIALALQALRAVDRYGVTKRGEQYAGWKAIAAPAPMFATADAAALWMHEYARAELNLDVPPAEIVNWAALYRSMAKRMHPDKGGPRADWDRLDEAMRMINTGRAS